jgi:membrane protein involved in colicin uptake
MQSGKIYDLSDVLVAAVSIVKPDGKVCYNDCVIDGSEIQYEVTTQTINVLGECIGQIELSMQDGAVITSPEFAIYVYNKILDPNIIESQNEYKSLVQQVAQAKDYCNQAEQYKTLSENAERNISAMESGFTEKATALEEYQNEISGMQETLRQQADDAKTLINMSVTEAGGYADEAKSSAAGAASSATEAGGYADEAKSSAAGAANSATEAGGYADKAKSSAAGAASSATEAAGSAAGAANSATEAGGYADEAKSSAAGAASSATEAKNYATGDKNSAKYYYEKTLELFNSLQNVIDSIGYPKGE